jgi:hypothetical protein
MFDYLQQFNSLPKDLRDKISSPEVMSSLSELEKRYQVDLAMVVMKVMIKSLAIKDLSSIFTSELNLSPEKAENLAQEMKEKIFSSVADYMGISDQTKVLNLQENIDFLIKEAGIAIPSSDLVERLRKILSTYLKGVRNRIDTRQTLAKDVKIGGLGLSKMEIDRILKVCDSKKYQPEISAPPPSVSNRLDEIISQDQDQKADTTFKKKQALKITEYDLKRALQSGETKSITSSPQAKVAGQPEEIEEKIINKEQPDFKQDSEASQAELEEELKKLEPHKEEDKQAEIVEKSKESEKAPFIVKKPESTTLFKKLFSESQKKATPGSIKFAAVAGNVPEQKKKIEKQATLSEEVEKSDNREIAEKELASRKITSKRPSTSSASHHRPRLEDVKVVPKVMGPLEELQFLDLTNFRRLGKTPEEITAKIFSKIKLLEKEGYDKMIAGISAWKKSPTNRLYLKAVQEAIASGKNLEEAISGKKENEINLSREEIEAIISLNSRLTF